MSKQATGMGFKKAAAKTWGHVWRRGFWRRLWYIILALFILFVGTLFGIGQWYIHDHQDEPIVMGASFIPDYAESFGLDPKDTLNAMLSQLHFKQIRLVSYWNDIEPSPGHYDFSQLDWEFAMAQKYDVKVSLAIGLRQPRWPECHEPNWVTIDPDHRQNWEPQLFQFMEKVINRYQTNPALQDYELENEFFMKVFGECKDFSRNRLIAEYNLVKGMDKKHPVIISRSDNWVGIPVGKPTPDEFAISIYKRVWDATFTHRYFEYPLPAWYYAALAGSEQIWSGRNMIVHELQAEPWTPRGLQITQTSVAEQYKSASPQRIKDRINYAEATGMKTIDLWGAEWWYWLKVKKNDPQVWNIVQQAVQQANTHNQKLEARNSKN